MDMYMEEDGTEGKGTGGGGAGSLGSADGEDSAADGEDSAAAHAGSPSSAAPPSAPTASAIHQAPRLGDALNGGLFLAASALSSSAMNASRGSHSIIQASMGLPATCLRIL